MIKKKTTTQGVRQSGKASLRSGGKKRAERGQRGQDALCSPTPREQVAAATFRARPRPLLLAYPEAAAGGGSFGGGTILSLRSKLQGGAWGGRSWPP